MRKSNRSHQTQWAAQFAVASELCKRGYEVSFTLGHSAPLADIVAISPVTKTTVLIDVKGLHKRNSWLVKRKTPRNNLFYVLAYIPINSPNEFYVFRQVEVNRCVVSELRRLRRSDSYPLTGLAWTFARELGRDFGILPD